MGDPAKVEEDFVRTTVRRSMPSLSRPRLQTAAEDRLADVERRSAECYAGMESFTHQLKQLAEHIDAEPEPDEKMGLDFGDEEDSLVQSVVVLRGVAKLED